MSPTSSGSSRNCSWASNTAASSSRRARPPGRGAPDRLAGGVTSVLEPGQFGVGVDGGRVGAVGGASGRPRDGTSAPRRRRQRRAPDAGERPHVGSPPSSSSLSASAPSRSLSLRPRSSGSQTASSASAASALGDDADRLTVADVQPAHREHAVGADEPVVAVVRATDRHVRVEPVCRLYQLRGRAGVWSPPPAPPSRYVPCGWIGAAWPYK